MTPTIYIGIDPGISGGIAAVANYIASGKHARFSRIPKSEGNIYRLLRTYAIASQALASSRSGSGGVIAVIEDIPPALPGTGKGSMSKLYGHYRMLRAFLVALDIPFTAVKSEVVWRALAIPPRRKKTESRSQWKQRLKRKAEELFPDLLITLATADALLFAHYCYLQENSQ